jgi:radical SAM-linked protein
MRIRLTFAKQGALRYTGHLDLHKIWERSARRAGLQLAYSQGFHPQPKIQIAAALPLGFSSRCEIVDMWLNNEPDLSHLGEIIQAAVPPGLQILTVETVDDRAPALQTLVDSAAFEVTVLDPQAQIDLPRRLSAVMEAETLPRERRGKAYDLKLLIESLEFLPPDKITMRLAARPSATGRPEEVLDQLGIPFEETRIERTRLILK